MERWKRRWSMQKNFTVVVIFVASVTVLLILLRDTSLQNLTLAWNLPVSEILFDYDDPSLIGEEIMAGFQSNNNTQFSVRTNKCNIPYIDPFNPEAMKYIAPTKSRPKCPDVPFLTLTYKKDFIIYVNRSNILSREIRFCTYIPFHMADERSKGYEILYHQFKVFHDKITASHHFVDVTCVNHHGDVISIKYYAFFFSPVGGPLRSITKARPKESLTQDGPDTEDNTGEEVKAMLKTQTKPNVWSIKQATPNRQKIKNDTIYEWSVEQTISNKWTNEATPKIEAPPITRSIYQAKPNDQNIKHDTPMSQTLPLKRSVKQSQSNMQSINADTSIVQNIKRASFRSKTQPNVILLGIDSTSRCNFLRELPKTYAFLQRQTGHVNMVGYNKMGLNTFPNLVAILTGMTVEQTGFQGTGYTDDLPFVWSQYAARGYKTFFIEDGVKIGMFNYQKRGFSHPPVDHYLRPYMVLWENLFANMDVCGRAVRQGDLVLDNLTEFVSTYSDLDPYMALAFISHLTHGRGDMLWFLDDSLYQFFNFLKTSGSLRNTFVFLFGDHGLRYGKYRMTLPGRLEEQLPFLSLLFPPSYIQKYPELYHNLRRNSHALTSNFDIHATLVNILQLNKSKIDSPSGFVFTSSKGISLLQPIPERTCLEAGIPELFCACGKEYEISRNSSTVLKIAHRMVTELNDLIKPVRNLCHTLTLIEIKYAYMSQPAKDTVSQQKYVNFNVGILVRPSLGTFECSYRASGGTLTRLGAILRTNMYKKQSLCVQGNTDKNITFDIEYERVCYCKDYVKKSLKKNVPAQKVLHKIKAKQKLLQLDKSLLFVH